ncbi:hypothetical protein Tco_0729818 [Tanacetum coccineum]|uniref:GDSL esterase/lipase n=1 Tax=Tanacetum coccineum TaxID=301880 RepID=A0ABQ4YQV0_9ASTR
MDESIPRRRNVGSCFVVRGPGGSRQPASTPQTPFENPFYGSSSGLIRSSLGGSEDDLLLEGSMYIISVGSNDIMEYLFKPLVPPEVLIANLTATYAIHLKVCLLTS